MKKIWFKRKRYGWGWTPSTWQGWVVIAAYLVIVIALGLATDRSDKKEVSLLFIIPYVTLTTALIVISYKKGESPGWQWGKRDTDAGAQ